MGELYISLATQMAAKFSGPGEFDSFLERHIRAASDYVDAALSKTFVVPLPLPAPSIIVTITAKETAYYAVAQFTENEDLLRDKHETAVAMLKAIAESGILPGSTITTRRIVGGSDPQVFTPTLLSRW